MFGFISWRDLNVFVLYLQDYLSGFQMAAYLKTVCDKIKLNKSNNLIKQKFYNKMMAIPDRKVLYCPVAKVSSTFWQRVTYLLARPSKKYEHPFEVPINVALSFKQKGYNPNINRKDWFQFMIVRNPYARLMSAYIDKIYVPNPTFWNKFGKSSIKMFRKTATKTSLTCGHDASFSEFVQFVIWSLSTNQMVDGHFRSVSETCMPCEINYTFIGRMESAADDFPIILNRIGLSHTVQTMGERFQNLTADDAIADSINSPFGWKTKILKCMNWNEALMRVWRKLQLRGLVGMSQKYPLSETNASKIRSSDFIKLAKSARQYSSLSELKEQKRSIFQDVYKTVPLDVVQKLRDVFNLDFKLFGYDDSPDSIFNQTYSKGPSYDYLNFRM